MKSVLSVCLPVLFLFFAVSCAPASEETSSGTMSSVDFSTMSPEDLARAYIEARQDYDIERIKPILADDVQITEVGSPMSIEDVASFLRYAEAVGTNWEIVSCDPAEGNANEISCPILLSSNISDALGVAPVAGNAFDFVIFDGKISAVDLSLNLDFWGGNVFNKLRGYIQQNHPESISKMFVNGDLVGVSDEGIELWRAYAAEYIASLNTQ